MQALLASLTPDVPDADGGKLTPDQVRALSEKLKELVGEDAADGFAQQHNARGEVCPRMRAQAVGSLTRREARE